jgi:hypothetical protein
VLAAVYVPSAKDETLYRSADNWSDYAERIIYGTSELNYVLTPSGYAVTGLSSPAEEVVIPSSYNAVPVTIVAAYAFKDDTGIKSVYIPSTVTSIGAGAFSGCTGLSKAEILSFTPVSIGAGAFLNCPAEAHFAEEKFLGLGVAGTRPRLSGGLILTVYLDFEISLSNPYSAPVSVTYNTFMCSEDSALSYTDTSRLSTLILPAKGTKTVLIKSVSPVNMSTPGVYYITASIDAFLGTEPKRYVSYTNGISPSGTNPVKHSVVFVK